MKNRLKRFMRFETKWSRLPLMLTWAGVVVNTASIFLGVEDPYPLITVMWLLQLPLWIQTLVFVHRSEKKRKWLALEGFVHCMIMEREFAKHGSYDSAQEMRKIRDFYTKL